MIRNAIFGLLLAFGIIAISVPSDALAQEQQEQAAEQATPTEQAALTEQATFGTLIAAINGAGAEIEGFQALDGLAVEDVQVVNVNDLVGDADAAAFNEALAQNEAEIAEWGNVLNENEVVTGVLTGAEVAVTDVVAVDVLSGGEVVVYYRPSA